MKLQPRGQVSICCHALHFFLFLFCSVRTLVWGFFDSVQNKRGKLPVSYLPLLSWRVFPRRAETQKDKLSSLKGCMTETREIQPYAKKFQVQNKVLHMDMKVSIMAL